MKKQLIYAGLAGLCFAAGCTKTANENQVQFRENKTAMYFSSLDNRIQIMEPGSKYLTLDVANIEVADFNGDGKLDIVIAGEHGQIVFLENRIGDTKVEKEE